MGMMSSLSAFELGLLAALAAALAIRLFAPPSRPPPPGPDWATPTVFVVVLLAQLVLHHVRDSAWIPHGPDWDSWLQSAFGFSGRADHPPNRWPAYGLVVATVDALTPGPTFWTAQVVSRAALAAVAAGVFRLGRGLVGGPGALVAAVLAVTAPMCLKMGGWTSVYPLWAAAVVWAVTGLHEAVRTQARGWWAVAGFSTGLGLACLPQALGLGLALTTLLGAGLVLSPGFRARKAPAAGLPFAALALFYVAFPSPLTSLEAAAGASALTTAETADATPVPPPPPGSPEVREDTGGYVFGRSMGPTTLFRAVTTASTRSDADTARNVSHSRNKMLAAFPTSGPATLALFALGPLFGVLAVRRDWRSSLIAWAALLSIAAGTLPALTVWLEHRYLLPLYCVLPLLLVTPLGVCTRHRSRAWRWAPLALVAVALLPGSPWRQAEVVRTHLAAVEVDGHRGASLAWEVARDFPDETIQVLLPPNDGLLVLERNEGRLLFADPRYSAREPVELDPGVAVLTDDPQGQGLGGPGSLEPPESPAPTDDLEGRPVLGRWEWEDRPLPIVLLGAQR